MVVIDEDGNLLRRIGSEAVTPFPNGIDISDAGDVLIGDSHGNQFHVAVYSNEGANMLHFPKTDRSITLFEFKYAYRFTFINF